MKVLSEEDFLVDRHTHRIVKRGGVWKLWCPKRSADPNPLILAERFDLLVKLLDRPCVEFVTRNGRLVALHHGLDLK